MLDEQRLKPRDLSDLMMGDSKPDKYTEIVISFEAAESPEENLKNQVESTDPGPNSHWGPVPFNGLAPPVEALMPDEAGQQSFVRTTHYNRHLEGFLFSGTDVHHAIWHSNKHMPFKPQLTLYRLWSDNYTYVADWDPRVVLNLLSGSIVYQIKTPQHEDKLGTIFKLMPARHAYALQHCAMRSAELVAESVQQVIAEFDGSWDGKQRARHLAPWMVYLFEMYQLWKDITGLDIARRNSQMDHTKRGDGYINNLRPSKGHPPKNTYKWNERSGKYGKSGDGPTYDVFAVPWYKSPYNPKVNAQKYKDKPVYHPWETPVPAIHISDIPWDSICDDVLVAAKSWRSIKKNHNKFRPRFKEILEAWEILGPKLRALGHGDRIDRMERSLTWRADGTAPNYLKDQSGKMCNWVKPLELCFATGHAMYMLMVAIRHQIEPVYWDV
jgi:hypothetical protein